jgi:outer membrane protein insertion porin family
MDDRCLRRSLRIRSSGFVCAACCFVAATLGWPSGWLQAQGPAISPASAAPSAGAPANSSIVPLAPLAPPSATPAVRQLVAEVRITGNAVTKDYQVQKHIQTRQDREFDPELVQADVRRLVSTGLFRDVRTYTKQSPAGVIVTYEVFERPRVQYVRHLGNRGMSEKKLNKEHGIKVGDAINAYTTEEGRRKIEELYHRGGYPNAQVTVMEGDKQGDKGVVYLVNEGQIERVSDVQFEGNKIASDERLKTQIESKPGILWYFFRGKVDRQKIDSDVEKLTAYYRSLGYFRARIGRELEFDDSGKWLTLKFIIDEGPRYTIRSVSMEGNTKFASPPLLEFLELKSGDYFDQARMNKDINTLIDLYGSQGYVFADVQADPRFLEEPGQLDLVYRVKEGQVFTVGDINVNIAGEFPHTRDTVVLNRIDLRPGDIIDARKMRDGERRLKASQLFNTNPQEGELPRVVVRPPDLDSIGAMAVRGQSPEMPPAAEKPWATVGVNPAQPVTPHQTQPCQPHLQPTHYTPPPVQPWAGGVQAPPQSPNAPSTLYSWDGPTQQPAVNPPTSVYTQGNYR